MDTKAQLKHIQSLLKDHISSALSNGDFAAVTALSGFAQECEALFEAEYASLNRRVEAVRSAPNGSSSTSTTPQKLTYSAEAPTTSAKAAGAQARTEWVLGLRAKGISLHGHGKRYQAARGRPVAVAFANELRELKNRWFLGITDEPTEIVVLLCKSVTGQFHDIVLPVSRLTESWRAQSKSKGELKINIKKDGNRFLLLVPGNEPVDVTRYVGNYGPLR